MAAKNDKTPIHPGEILSEEFLKPHGLSANNLAERLDIPVNRLTEIIRGRRGISGETAVLLGIAFGTTSEFWLNLQSHYELEVAQRAISPARLKRASKVAKDLRAA